jgi:hypothetical protein
MNRDTRLTVLELARILVCAPQVNQRAVGRIKSIGCTSIIPKLNSTCYIMRSIRSYMTLNVLKTIYYSYFNSIMSYGLILGGNTPHSLKIIRMQKKKQSESWWAAGVGFHVGIFFRKLGILPLLSQYIFSLVLFVVNNKDFFILNSEKHNLSTRQSNNIHQTIANFTVYQKGVYCMGISVFNNLPPNIKDISHNPRKFEICLKYFLHTHYF